MNILIIKIEVDAKIIKYINFIVVSIECTKMSVYNFQKFQLNRW